MDESLISNLWGKRLNNILILWQKKPPNLKEIKNSSRSVKELPFKRSWEMSIFNKTYTEKEKQMKQVYRKAVLM